MDATALNQLAQAINTLNQRTQYLVTSMIGARKRIACGEAVRRFDRDGEGARPEMPVQFRSQYGEDVLLWDLFGGAGECPGDGFFIECGAADGLSLSVSYAFEAMGWTGLLVEPVAAAFDVCRAARCSSHVVHAAVGRRGASGEAELTVARDMEQLSYVTTSHAHEQRVAREARGAERVRVPLTSLAEILRRTGAGEKTIDFAVIDVEGGEVDALDGLELERSRPRVLIVEENPQAPGRESLADFMKKQPYKCVGTLWVNRVYVHERETAILKRAQTVQF